MLEIDYRLFTLTTLEGTTMEERERRRQRQTQEREQRFDALCDSLHSNDANVRVVSTVGSMSPANAKYPEMSDVYALRLVRALMKSSFVRELVINTYQMSPTSAYEFSKYFTSNSLSTLP